MMIQFVNLSVDRLLSLVYFVLTAKESGYIIFRLWENKTDLSIGFTLLWIVPLLVYIYNKK